MTFDKEYYSIGEVAKICHLNVRTLHYYDEIGLLTPAYIDKNSNYRYYTFQQILEITIIKEFKFIGFSLKEVKSLLKRDDLVHNRKMLEVKCHEIDNTIKALSLLKSRLEKRVEAIEQHFELESTDKIVIKDIDQQYIAYIDFVSACHPNQFNRKFVELMNQIEQSGLEIIGDRYAIFNEDITTINYDHAHIRLYIPVKTDQEITNFVMKIPQYKAITMMYDGTYGYLGEAHEELYRYTQDHQINIDKKKIINRFIIDIATSKDKDQYMTEIMLVIENESEK
ncbi:MAG: MerR family transcriptional regulator [Coprobacillus sp.]